MFLPRMFFFLAYIPIYARSDFFQLSCLSAHNTWQDKFSESSQEHCQLGFCRYIFSFMIFLRKLLEKSGKNTCRLAKVQFQQYRAMPKAPKTAWVWTIDILLLLTENHKLHLILTAKSVPQKRVFSSLKRVFLQNGPRNVTVLAPSTGQFGASTTRFFFFNEFMLLFKFFNSWNFAIRHKFSESHWNRGSFSGKHLFVFPVLLACPRRKSHESQGSVWIRSCSTPYSRIYDTNLSRSWNL